MNPISLAHLRDAIFVLLPGWQDNPWYKPVARTEAIVKCSARTRVVTGRCTW